MGYFLQFVINPEGAAELRGSKKCKKSGKPTQRTTYSVFTRLALAAFDEGFVKETPVNRVESSPHDRAARQEVYLHSSGGS